MKHKTEIFSSFTKYKKRAERFRNSDIVNIRTDNGMELCYTEFNKFLEDQGIHAERANVYSPEQNGVSEPFNYTAMDAAKAMLKDSGLGNGFWVEALLCFTCVWNRVCHEHQKKTPFELFGGRKPSVKHFKIFVTTAYVGVLRQTRKTDSEVNYDISNHESSDEVKTEVETEITKEVEPESPIEIKTENFDEADNLRTPLNEVVWVREAAPRRDKYRTDIFYKVERFNSRLNSKKAVASYCKSNNIKYDPIFFNFSGKNTYSGIVKEGTEDSSETLRKVDNNNTEA
ncbi:Copia protein [Araneus ventricosus]|uniref:Copia protein n=1 Tax=Araneus ventricosus TaxID=182803 RepID=A0A4Y2JVZ9_ARAVE|nr:Copia protein [Araneus ventricosus]